MDSGDLVPLVPLSEDPDHCRNRVRVGHGLHLGHGLVAELFVLEPRLPALEPDLWPQLFSDVSCIALWISS